jgi:tetratricopeptide (TPR) repeat protein
MFVFAFLNSDAIPEDIITKGSSALNPLLRRVGNDSLLLNDAISTLLAYSLIRRNSDHTLTVHRLVQSVLMSGMSQKIQRLWVERVVRTINLAFPEEDYTNWQQCQKYILHIQSCVDHIIRLNLAFPEAADLLTRVGKYLVKSAQYEQAEVFYQQALTFQEKVLGPEHPDTATTLHQMAHLYQEQGKYEQAETFHQRELTIRDKVFGPEHPDTAHSLFCMAGLYREQGKYEQAEVFYQRALSIREKVLGLEHPATKLVRDKYIKFRNAKNRKSRNRN